MGDVAPGLLLAVGLHLDPVVSLARDHTGHGALLFGVLFLFVGRGAGDRHNGGDDGESECVLHGQLLEDVQSRSAYDWYKPSRENRQLTRSFGWIGPTTRAPPAGCGATGVARLLHLFMH